MRKLIKKLFFKYQRVMWYKSIAKTEILKPLGELNEWAWVVLVLANYGVKPSIPQIGGAYVFLVGFFTILGIVIVKSGTIKYTTSLGNEQNEEIQEVIQRLKNIEDAIRK